VTARRQGSLDDDEAGTGRRHRQGQPQRVIRIASQRPSPLLTPG
jgi:hypothetical protein